MICPQCGREMEPIIDIPFRWQCDNHPMRLSVPEPLPTLWYIEPTTSIAVEEARLAEQWAQRLAERQPQRRENINCPSCHNPMQYNLTMHQWECHALQPPMIITDEEIARGLCPLSGRTMTPEEVRGERPMAATEVLGTRTGRININMDAFLDPQPPIDFNPWIMQQMALAPPLSWLPEAGIAFLRTKTDKTDDRRQREREAKYREVTVEWFNPMPKSLKLLFIAEDKESQEMMEHFKSQDTKHITFRNMYGSCQRMLIRTYMEQHPDENQPEMEVPF